MESMSNVHTPFWRALLDQCGDRQGRARLWNGYIGWKLPPNLKGDVPKSGWPQFAVKAPPVGWPDLTDDEKSLLDDMAAANGGHPDWRQGTFMDFAGCEFQSGADFSELTLVAADFRAAHFRTDAAFNGSRFFMQSRFDEVSFDGAAHFYRPFFEADAHFDKAQFKAFATFVGVQFNGGASFSGAVFEQSALFNDSRFVESYFSGGIAPLHLADFTQVDFRDRVSFREVVFGEDPTTTVKRLRPQRLADFSDARFRAATDFRRAVFNKAPAFFNCSLHEDTDFNQVQWPTAMPEPRDVDLAIRAWERLELTMSQLEKPLDRHLFYRLKMRARRLTDGRFLRLVNFLFDLTSDYGWGVTRATVSWFAHWFVAGLALYVNAGQAAVGDDALSLLLAAVATSFANAHAFLGLAAEGGYLASCRSLIVHHDHGGLVATLGVAQSILGPVFLFLLLLTLRNRFRLA